MCSELNNKLSNKTLAEIKNDRLLFDLKIDVISSYS